MYFFNFLVLFLVYKYIPKFVESRKTKQKHKKLYSTVTAQKKMLSIYVFLLMLFCVVLAICCGAVFRLFARCCVACFVRINI